MTAFVLLCHSFATTLYALPQLLIFELYFSDWLVDWFLFNITFLPLLFDPQYFLLVAIAVLG